MGDLTFALSLVGGLVIAGMLGHAAWQTRKVGPRRAEPQREPTFGDPEPASAPAGDAADADAAPPLTEQEGNGADATVLPPKARTSVRRSAPRLDALIDAIVPLTLEAPVSAEFVLAHLPPTRRAGSKPVLIEGRDAQTGEWEQPQVGAAGERRYDEIQVGLLMANRSGALNDIEYSEFVQKVEAFAEGIGAMPDMPDMLEVVARARELDAFASQYDAQLAVHLRARGSAWSVGYLQQHAATHGFISGTVPGRLVLPAGEEGAPPVLTLSFDSQAALAALAGEGVGTPLLSATLSFDVPQTDAAAKPFEAWQKSAETLAADIDAMIVDDDGRPLSSDGFAAIGRELERLYEALQSRDLPAGSPAARRLFS